MKLRSSLVIIIPAVACLAAVSGCNKGSEAEALRSEVGVLKTTVASLQSQVSSLEGKLQQITSRLLDVDGQLPAINASLRDLKNEVTKLVRVNGLTETPPEPPKKENLPVGIVVEGKKGMVYSPYAQDQGQVDVEGFPSGTRVECPYTGKYFRVP